MEEKNYIAAQEEAIGKLPLEHQVAKWKEKYNVAMNVCRRLMYEKLDPLELWEIEAQIREIKYIDEENNNRL